MQQTVTLTGLGTHKFKAALESILFIQSLFEKEIQSVKLASWSPGNFQDQLTVDLRNRYFAGSAFATTVVPFDTQVDPDGLLNSIAGGSLLHTEENRVRYFQRVEKTENKFK
jgi:hypothetical protein